MDHQKLFAIMSGKDRSAKAHLMRAGLSCAEPFYRAATAARNKLFDWNIRKATQLPRPTISVGNITTGGTGKTPMVIALAKKLLAMGEKPAVLLRGYQPKSVRIDPDPNGSKASRIVAFRNAGFMRYADSDEHRVYHQTLGEEVSVVPFPDRVKAANWIVDRQPETTVFLLDDGFQHRKVARDLNLVLIDATQPFGFNHVLPRGLLREGIRNLRRADAIIITRCEQIEPDALFYLEEQLVLSGANTHSIHASFGWSSLRDEQDQDFSIDLIQSQRVLGVAGIGNPKAFGQMLSDCCDDATLMSYKDHHTYTTDDLREIARGAADYQAIVTTEKDWVKWRPLWPNVETTIPVYRPVLDIRFNDGEEALDELIRERVLASNPTISGEPFV